MDFIQFTLIDIIDIILVALIMYYGYRLTKGTHAPSILIGVIIIYFLWVVVRALNMELLTNILGNVIGVGVIAIFIVFQPEIRRFLHLIGKQGRQSRNTFIARLFDADTEQGHNLDNVRPIVKACSDMSKTKTGALIVIKRDTDLSFVEESGIKVDSHISSSLLKTIFFKNSPLHDGAVVIVEGRISSASCILPLAQNEELIKAQFGMRHRAALGLCEVSDAVVVVVSEETGSISIIMGDTVDYDIDPTELQVKLLNL